MAWSETLLDCSFRGFVFDVVKTEDKGEHAISKHSYPYVDGSDLEDMGLEGLTISIEAKFWDGVATQPSGQLARVSGYESRLRDFLDVLDQRGSGELIHPIYGSLWVQVIRYQVRHEADDVDQCFVHVEFEESNSGDRPFFDRRLPAQKVELISYRGGVARTALGNAIANVIDSLRNSAPLAALNNLRQGMMGPILATLSDVHGVLLSGLDVLKFPRAWANDISSVVDGILDLRDFGAQRLADWKSVGNALSLFDLFKGGSSVAPEQMRAGVTPTEAQALAATQASVYASQSIGLANAAGLVLAAESDPQLGQTLSPPEIEAIVNQSRAAIEAAIVAIRAIYPLETARSITEPMKNQALALQEAARALIEARPPLLQKSVEAPGNLRLIAHRWYGDHTRAVELARLNPGLRLSNNLRFGDVLNAYAG